MRDEERERERENVGDSLDEEDVEGGVVFGCPGASESQGVRGWGMGVLVGGGMPSTTDTLVVKVGTARALCCGRSGAKELSTEKEGRHTPRTWRNMKAPPARVNPTFPAVRSASPAA